MSTDPCKRLCVPIWPAISTSVAESAVAAHINGVANAGEGFYRDAFYDIRRHNAVQSPRRFSGHLYWGGRKSISYLHMNHYQKTFTRMQRDHHSKCIFNSVNKSIGTSLRTAFDDEGRLNGTFFCHEAYQGYDEMLHGGVISAVADAVMAKCLMGHGVLGYTYKLNVRFIKPVTINNPLAISCYIDKVHYNKLFRMKASMSQNGSDQMHIRADGDFFKVN
ncbi:MAG: hypothetical protein GF398_02590 [Chitinivibrionales bacterium]|nr:hypothetical protein [Chitinivibrionales bacterium]